MRSPVYKLHLPSRVAQICRLTSPPCKRHTSTAQVPYVLQPPGRSHDLLRSWAWTSTTSSAIVARGSAPVAGQAPVGPDGEELRSWT